jgi:hypothetical protein
MANPVKDFQASPNTMDTSGPFLGPNPCRTPGIGWGRCLGGSPLPWAVFALFLAGFWQGGMHHAWPLQLDKAVLALPSSAHRPCHGLPEEC